MTRTWVLAVALMTLGAGIACSNSNSNNGAGGGGGGNGIQVSVAPGGQTVGVTLTQQFTASVTGSSNTAVTWSLSGTGCTGAACGTIDSGGKYTAPNTPPNPATVTVTAKSQADNTKSDSAIVTVIDISVIVTPTPADVALSASQPFVAVAVPDAAPQTFTWTVSCTTGNCGSVTPDANDPTVALYTAPDTLPNPANSVKVTATSTVDSQNRPKSGSTTVTVVNSRFPAPNTTYAFRLSGFNITGMPIAMVGNFKTANSGAIQSGEEDELAPGPFHHTIDSGSSITMASNNGGTLTLHASDGTSNTYTIVLDASGDIQMIESTSDGTNRRASGVIEPASGSKFNNAALTGNFVFGFAGTDANGKRVGYIGVFTMDGVGNVTGGLLDVNRAAGGTNGAPLTILPSSSSSSGYGVGATGMGTLTLATTGQAFTFNMYVVSGNTNGGAPLTLYAISKDSANPAVSGTLTFQDPSPTYNNAALNKSLIANLTGVDSAAGTRANTALSLAIADGTGHLSGVFDQNNGGTITSGQNFGTGYTYSATACGGTPNCGRYSLNLLGNPGANPPAPMQFIFYAIAANRGFLLDQSSSSVLTGTVEQQKGNVFAASELPGLFAASSISSATNNVVPTVADMLLSSPGNSVFQVVGTRWDSSGSQPALAGSYTLMSIGVGTMKLTSPGAENYAIYVLDNTSQIIHRFLMMNVDPTTTDPSIISAQQ